MSIEINENIRAIVFAPFADKADFMAAVSEEADGFAIIGRLRFYNSPDPWDESDRKHWYRARTQESLVDAVRVLKEMVARLELYSVAFGQRSKKEEMTILYRADKSLEEFVKEFREQPWAHSKEMKIQ